jgi:hypothetical protein
MKPGDLRWKRRGGVRNGGDVGAIAERFTAIEKRRGRLTAADVVDDARAKSSPLHLLFDWDDGVAAEKWRLRQASDLIASIEVVYKKRDGEHSTIRAYVSVTGKRGREYAPIARAMSDRETREQILGEAKGALDAWVDKYEHLQEFAAVVSAARRVK